MTTEATGWARTRRLLGLDPAADLSGLRALLRTDRLQCERITAEVDKAPPLSASRSEFLAGLLRTGRISDEADSSRA